MLIYALIKNEYASLFVEGNRVDTVDMLEIIGILVQGQPSILIDCKSREMKMEKEEIDALMKKHLKAVEENDIDTFMETWADNARIVLLLTGTVVEGKEDLRKTFQEQLFNPNLGIKTEIANELHFNNFRTYIEQITECADSKFVGLEVHWTIEFKDGKINRAWTLQ
jgi:hypothetical protein